MIKNYAFPEWHDLQVMPFFTQPCREDGASGHGEAYVRKIINKGAAASNDPAAPSFHRIHHAPAACSHAVSGRRGDQRALIQYLVALNSETDAFGIVIPAVDVVDSKIV